MSIIKAKVLCKKYSAYSVQKGQYTLRLVKYLAIISRYLPALLIIGDDQFDIASQPVSLSGSESEQIAGENYTLTCQVTGGRTAISTYQWFKNGSLLVNRTSATLSFSPLRESDSGVYTCEGTSTNTSESVTITVDGKCKCCMIFVKINCYKHSA